jgi:hypothetical protein
MEQRTMILRAWARGGEREARTAVSARMATAAAVAPTPRISAAARTFAEMMRDNPEACWEDMVKEFRAQYYDALEELIPPLLDLDDPLITLNLVRFADPTRPREVALLRQLIAQSDPERHQHSLRAVAEMGNPDLVAAIQRKRNLPDSVKEVLGQPAPRPRPRKRAPKSG